MTQPNSTSDATGANSSAAPDGSQVYAANGVFYQQMPPMQQPPYGSYVQDGASAYAMPGQQAPQMYGAPEHQQNDAQPYQPMPAPQQYVAYDQYQQYAPQQYMPQQAYAQGASAQVANVPQYQQQPVQYQYPQGYQYPQPMPYVVQGPAYGQPMTEQAQIAYAHQPPAAGQMAYPQPTFGVEQVPYVQQAPIAEQVPYGQQGFQPVGTEPAVQVVEPLSDVQPVAGAGIEQPLTAESQANAVSVVAPLPVEETAPKATFESDEWSGSGAKADDTEPEDADDDATADVSSRSYMQNRELSWLTFNERVLDQGADESVPLLERLNFISIFWSNLQEFFMVRVGSLTDLTFIDPPVIDSKTGMSAEEQIKAIHERCRELYPIQESNYEHVRGSLAKHGVRHLRPDDLSDEQKNYLSGFVKYNIEPFLSPQIINPQHPFPHLENGKLYILVRLDDGMQVDEEKKKKKGKKDKKAKKGKESIESVVLGLIPLPHQCDRIIKLPGRGYQFILLEHAIELFAADIFSMYKTKHTNVICVTRNADIDANQTGDEQDEDYREHMRRLLKKRARLAPVRLECERPMQPVVLKYMLKRLKLKRSQVYDTIAPLDLSFTWGLGSRLTDKKRAQLSNPPFTPAWPTAFKRKGRIMDQIGERDILLSYPYESMDPFVQLLKEAAFDPDVISIKITLYRLASQSQLAEALITAAENGKEVTALFELRARFDESNNIEWSQRFEQAGCNVIYGFRDYKVHSKICCIARKTPEGIRHITQLGTGNYNEKTAKLYTDFSYITTNEAFGRDAVRFFRNMQLEHVSDEYEILRVAPLQIKPMILDNLDHQIELARQGKPCGAFLKANSVTDKDVIEKIAEASQAGVGITLFVRGICCLVPEVKGATENVRVVSIVGRLLEHSRIYCFGTPDDCTMYLSSADLMTRNLNKRVEIAWPIVSEDIRWRILDYIDICLHDTAKLRELRPNKTYTPLGAFYDLDEEGNSRPAFDAQAALIERAAEAARKQEVEAEKAEQSQLYEQSVSDETVQQAEEEPVAVEPAAEPEIAVLQEVPAPDVTAEIPAVEAVEQMPAASTPEQAQENLTDMPLDDLLGQADFIPFSQPAAAEPIQAAQGAEMPPANEMAVPQAMQGAAPAVEAAMPMAQAAEPALVAEMAASQMAQVAQPVEAAPAVEGAAPQIMQPVQEAGETSLADMSIDEILSEPSAPADSGAPAETSASTEASAPAEAVDEQEQVRNFFDDRSREIEMPPEKKGFFSRRRKN